MKSLSGKSSKHLKRNLIVAAVIVILAGAGVFAYRAATTTPAKDTTATATETKQSDTKVNEKPATNDEKQAGQSQKQTIVDQDETPATTPSAVTVTITAANQNGAVFNIRSLIGTVTSSGTCTLTLTKAGVTVTKTSGIQALADSSTCKGFDIPTSELSKGTWHAVLDVTVGTAKGKAEQNIVVN